MHIKPTPKKPIPSGRRTITEVPDNELKEAVMDMVNRLHIPGKGNGYDLYTAILEEKNKAFQHLKKLSSTEDWIQR